MTREGYYVLKRGLFYYVGGLERSGALHLAQRYTTFEMALEVSKVLKILGEYNWVPMFIQEKNNDN